MAIHNKQKMTDSELVSKVNAEVALCNTQSESYLSDQRINSNYSFANEYTTYTSPTTGMSGVKLNFTPSVVNTLVMYNSKVFCSNKDTVKFSTSMKDPNAHMGAEQLGAAVNNIIHRQNNGFDIISEMLRSAAVNKNSVAKVIWSDKPVRYQEVLDNVSAQEVQQYIFEKQEMGYEVEIVEQEVVVESMTQTMIDQITGEEIEVVVSDEMANYTFLLERMQGCIDISVLPPEEFLINEDTTSINNDDLTRFVAHRREMYLSDAMMMFPDADESDFGMGDITFYQQEKASRHAVDGTYTQYGDSGGSDEETQKVEIIETWIRADRDNDGFAEWRHCFTSASNLLMDEEWYGPLPFTSYTFFPIPHKFYGLSVYDRIKSYEEAATGLIRSELDMARRKNTTQMVVKSNDSTDALRRFIQNGKPGVFPGGQTFSADDVFLVPTPPGGTTDYQVSMEELRKQVIADIGIDPVTGQVSTDIEKSGNDAVKTSMAIDNASVKIEGYTRRFADGPLRDISWLCVMEMIKNKDDPFVQMLIEGVTPGVPFIAGQMGLEKVISKTDITSRVGLGHQTGHQKIQASQVLNPMLQMLKQDPDPATYGLMIEAMKGLQFDSPESLVGDLEFWQRKAQELKQVQQQQMQLQQQELQNQQAQIQMQAQQIQFDQQLKLREQEFNERVKQAETMAKIEEIEAKTGKAAAETRKILAETQAVQVVAPANLNVVI